MFVAKNFQEFATFDIRMRDGKVNMHVFAFSSCDHDNGDILHEFVESRVLSSCDRVNVLCHRKAFPFGSE